jgi:hypothetical protein
LQRPETRLGKNGGFDVGRNLGILNANTGFLALRFQLLTDFIGSFTVGNKLSWLCVMCATARCASAKRSLIIVKGSMNRSLSNRVIQISTSAALGRHRQKGSQHENASYQSGQISPHRHRDDFDLGCWHRGRHGLDPDLKMA